MTIFILVAILIAAIVLLFFFYVKPNYISDVSGGVQFELCVKDAIEQGIDELAPSAGYINPTFNYMHDDIKYAYLCYTNQDFVTCTIQQPFPKNHFEENLELYTKERIYQCYDDSLAELKAQGYGVEAGTLTYDISLEPGVAKVNILAPTTVGNQEFKTFNYKVNTPIYDILMIVTSLVQSEAYYGDTDISTMMYYYQDYIIDKWKQGDSTTLYTVQNKNFNTKYHFASRSLAWPAGY